MTSPLPVLMLAAILTVSAQVARAADSDEAARAARQILAALQALQVEQVWDAQTSEFFKSRVSRDAFVATVTAGREPLGEPGRSDFLQMTTADADEATGYEGTIYAFSYRNAYDAGVYIERIVVIEDPDGEFRLSGLWGAPVPQEPALPQ